MYFILLLYRLQELLRVNAIPVFLSIPHFQGHCLQPTETTRFSDSVSFMQHIVQVAEVHEITTPSLLDCVCLFDIIFQLELAREVQLVINLLL